MDCIYLNLGNNQHYCHAQPMRQNEVIAYYQPTEEERKEFCNNTTNFWKCPRFSAMQNILKR